MKRAIKSAFFMALLLPLLAMGKASYPSLLPSNPFYFAKESVRNLRRALTFNYVSKVDLELRITDERLREIQKLKDLNMEDQNYLANAITAYQNSLPVLEDHVSSIREINPNIVGPLLDNLTDWYMRHALAFTGLSGGNNNEIEDGIARVLVSSFGQLQTVGDFRQRIINLLKDNTDPAKELEVAEVLSDLGKYMVSKRSWTEWFGLKEDLLIVFTSRVRGGEITFRMLDGLPGDGLVRLKTLDEAREKVSDHELKSQISVLRQQLLDKYNSLGLMSGSAVAFEISNVQKLISSIDAKKVDGLLTQVKYSLTQAQKSLSEGNYSVAFGHISLANALVNNLIWDLLLDADGRVEEVMLLKQSYDKLSEQSAKLVIEKKIIALSELVKSSPYNSQVISTIRDIKFMLAQAR